MLQIKLNIIFYLSTKYNLYLKCPDMYSGLHVQTKNQFQINTSLMSTDALLVECNSTIRISELVGVGGGWGGAGEKRKKESARNNFLIHIQ